MSATLEPVIYEFLRPMGADADELTKQCSNSPTISAAPWSARSARVLVFTCSRHPEGGGEPQFRVARGAATQLRAPGHGILSMMVIGPSCW